MIAGTNYENLFIFAVLTHPLRALIIIFIKFKSKSMEVFHQNSSKLLLLLLLLLLLSLFHSIWLESSLIISFKFHWNKSSFRAFGCLLSSLHSVICGFKSFDHHRVANCCSRSLNLLICSPGLIVMIYSFSNANNLLTLMVFVMLQRSRRFGLSRLEP